MACDQWELDPHLVHQVEWNLCDFFFVLFECLGGGGGGGFFSNFFPGGFGGGFGGSSGGAPGAGDTRRRPPPPGFRVDDGFDDASKYWKIHCRIRTHRSFRLQYQSTTECTRWWRCKLFDGSCSWCSWWLCFRQSQSTVNFLDDQFFGMIIEFFSEPIHNTDQIQPILDGLALELQQLIPIDVVHLRHHQVVVLILAVVRYLTLSFFLKVRWFLFIRLRWNNSSIKVVTAVHTLGFRFRILR